MSDDISRAAPISGLGLRDAAQDRNGGHSRGPFRRPSRADGHGEDQSPPEDREEDAEGNSAIMNRVKDAYRAGQALGHPVQGGGRVVRDETSVMGLPVRLMTPRIQEAITGLMTEMESLRVRLDAGENRVHDLAGLADGDGVLPVLNRWALVRDLEKRLEGLERNRCLVASFFYLESFEELRRIAGLDAALSALTGLAVELLARCGLGALVGTPGGAALVVAWEGKASDATTLASKMGAWSLARRRSLEAAGHSWSGVTLHPRLAVAVAVAHPGEGAIPFLARLERGARN
ncbi:MAG: diguanylate cyclase [Rhodospirillum sp.]|nr:diguanylate cyclase [Rhodospirillum sp.]MCF8491955.1 diguanylate cyclase [Rhodospirillum sp.]MCF8501103.1 diguanylate cyclase [Rhodospirillum sp.]